MQPQRSPQRQDLAGQFRAMQEQLVQAQSMLAATEVTGRAGEGAVAITLSASGKLSQVRLDPAVVDPARVAHLERLIMDAYADAALGVQELTQRMMAPLSALVARAEQETD